MLEVALLSVLICGLLKPVQYSAIHELPFRLLHTAAVAESKLCKISHGAGGKQGTFLGREKSKDGVKIIFIE